jgi:hypothetical protein
MARSEPLHRGAADAAASPASSSSRINTSVKRNLNRMKDTGSGSARESRCVGRPCHGAATHSTPSCYHSMGRSHIPWHRRHLGTMERPETGDTGPIWSGAMRAGTHMATRVAPGDGFVRCPGRRGLAARDRRDGWRRRPPGPPTADPGHLTTMPGLSEERGAGGA